MIFWFRHSKYVTHSLPVWRIPFSFTCRIQSVQSLFFSSSLCGSGRNRKQVDSTESTTSCTSPISKITPSHSAKQVHSACHSLRLGSPPSEVCLLAPPATSCRHLPGWRPNRRRLVMCLRSWCRWLKGATWCRAGWTLLKICVTSNKKKKTVSCVDVWRVVCRSDWNSLPLLSSWTPHPLSLSTGH